MRTLRVAFLIAAVGVVSLLHYQTATSQVALHQLFQRAYYVPILLTALWFGWRGGLLAAGVSGVFYMPHIMMAWRSDPHFRMDQYVEIVMFFVIGTVTGLLADHERAQRRKVEETARKLSDVYAELQKSFEQLRRVDRLSALGELSAGLAHEIRNPLGSIEGAVQILRRRELPEETRQEFAELAGKEILRLRGLLSNFLEFARPQPPQRVVSDPILLLESVAKLTTETATLARVSLRVESQEIPALAIDSEQIKQVLLNLVINAIQAMPEGGEVVLRAATDAGTVRLEVQDEGIGIPPEDVERIFDPFYTTRANGTGLGLSIAYQIVSQHGGHITASRNAQRGMTFAVNLPLTQEVTLASEHTVA